MKLGYFTMPVHPLHRIYTETLQEDRDAIIFADQLGFHDAFVGEHLTDQVEAVTNSMLFLATLIHATKTIKLATGTCNLSHAHPALIAAQAAMFDHLAKGRFIFGISPGALSSDAEALGLLDQDRNQIFAEAIDVILAIWQGTPPYDIDLPGNRFKISTARTRDATLGVGAFPSLYQKPLPEIVGTVVAPFSKGVISMGERDFHPLSANFLLPRWAKTHWDNYAQGKINVGNSANPADWRIARCIFVADSDREATRYARDNPASPYRFYLHQLFHKLKRAGRHSVFKEYFEQPDEELTPNYIYDRLVIHGSVDRVVDQILALHEETGDFGELVYAGMDWVDERLAKRSMELMATQVMPRVNSAISARAKHQEKSV